MTPVVTAEQMRAAEAACFDASTTQVTLMDRAGLAVAREAARFALEQPILVLAGPGNNGGDGFAAARLLRAWGYDVAVAALGDDWSGAAGEMRAAWTGDTVPLSQAPERPVIVDALFGIGLSRPMDAAVGAAMNRLRGAARFVLAVDIASGVNTDDGRVMGHALRADATLALGAFKRGHVQGDGLDLSGALLHAPIGIRVDARVRMAARPRLKAPTTRDHKYSRGLVEVIGGVMPGASRLAAAAARGGAGYVVLVSDDARVPLDAIVVRENAELSKAAAILIGPGLGRDDDARPKLREALTAEAICVIDGDALALLSPEEIRARAAHTILTPHGGEFARLFGKPDGDLIEPTIDAARRSGAVVVHKGATTVIAGPDGQAVVLNPPSWLSSAGTGDVLAGLIAARAAVTADPMRAACEAVWLHARAAKLAGPAMVADDVPMHLSKAIAECL